MVDVSKISWDAIRARKARDSLLEFTLYTFPNYKVNWHHRLLCEYLERWAFGDIKRLIVSMPPRTGKSELVSRRLPAWIFGRNPDAQIISASYSMDLATKMNRDVQRIIDDERYHDVFPNTKLFGKFARSSSKFMYLRNTEVFEIVNHKGMYKCAGVGSGITGMGFTHGIIDDPIKDRRDAESSAMQDALWDWYTSTFYTRRINDDARILITMTRWNTKDLVGRLLDLQEEDPNADKWMVISFPMIAEEPLMPGDPRKPGEPLWPERFSLESLKVSRAIMGPYDWAALMQQNPIASGGTIFNRGWWRFYDEEPFTVAGYMDELLQSWDMTFAGGPNSDYVVGQVWGRKGADKYLLDQVRFQGDFVETVAAFRRLSEKWPRATRKLVEKKANGDAVIASLRHEIAGIIPVTPMGGKIVRARAVAPEVESGNVYLPSGKYCPWVHDFIEEVSLFPNVKHDDQCFVEGTLIATTRGDVPIEDVRAGDYVIVPGGTARVIAAGRTGAGFVIEKCGLVGTVDHPVYSKRNGFIPLERIDVPQVDRLCLTSLMEWTYRKLLYSTVLNTNSWGREDIIIAGQIPLKGGHVLRDCMWRFGNFIQDKQYLMAMSFITKTAIHLITTMKIWFAYRVRSIINCTPMSVLKSSMNILGKYVDVHLSGIGQQKVENGTRSTENKAGRIENIRRTFVNTVARLLNPGATGSQNTVQTNVDTDTERNTDTMIECSSVCGVDESLLQPSRSIQGGLEGHAVENVQASWREVYNLTVESAHVYYANGILVSNCDAFTQAISNMLSRGTYVPPSMPQKPVVVSSGVENLFTTRNGVMKNYKRLVAPVR